jgi:hypothetical protein
VIDDQGRKAAIFPAFFFSPNLTLHDFPNCPDHASTPTGNQHRIGENPVETLFAEFTIAEKAQHDEIRRSIFSCRDGN